MDGVSCAEQQHINKFQSAQSHHQHQNQHQLYRSFRDLDIPPRKLLTRRLAGLMSPEPSSMDIYHHLQNNESPRLMPDESTLFQKFLPYNSGFDDESDPYASDQFRMYEFKIRKCTRSRSHDWTDCPFAHPGEKARRRCPRRFNYSGTVCPDFRRGSCSRGDNCEFSHGVFECWLHPSRYRTEACKDGKNCMRKICFFAHTTGQLRSVAPPPETKHVNSEHCAHCHFHPGIPHTTSPTSILDMEKLSPPATSPPFSPAQTGNAFSPISRFSDRLARAESSGMSQLGKNKLMSGQDIKELMQSMKTMNMNDQAPNMNWDSSSGNHDDQHSLFAFPPSAPSPLALPRDEFNLKLKNKMNESSTGGAGGPDLDWVNDLLM